jgi:hypothetical protein
VTENSETEEEDPQPKLGQLETSEDAVPVMHLSWKERPVKESRLELPPNELSQVQPSKLKSP